MFKIIALAVAVAATATVASAQSASTTAKSTVKTSTSKNSYAKSATTPRRRHAAKKSESKSALQKEAKISEATARATALKEVPNGKVKSSELERENGKLVYSFDITVPGKSGVEEVNVDATDGSVASHTHESAKYEKKEAAKEAKEKK